MSMQIHTAWIVEQQANLVVSRDRVWRKMTNADWNAKMYNYKSTEHVK